MTDWQPVTACPLCGVSAPTQRDVRSGAQVGMMNTYGIEIPLSFAIRYCRCYSCDMIFQDPMLTDEARHTFYTGGMYKEMTVTKNNFKTEIIRADRLMKMIEHLEIESILDIGCGHGELLQACQGVGIEVQGVDLNVDCVMNGIPVVESLQDVGGTYDMVSMVHYLEHITSPVAELVAAQQWSNRYVLVDVPLQSKEAYWLNLPHTLIFKPHTLVSAMERAGLNMVGMGMTERDVTAIGERKGERDGIR